jgi:hypothetical protein
VIRRYNHVKIHVEFHLKYVHIKVDEPVKSVGLDKIKYKYFLHRSKMI